MKVWAFDVDETLEISGGPVKLSDITALREEGHCVGLCGNWPAVTTSVEGWYKIFSFLGQLNMNLSKVEFLGLLKFYIPAEEYVMVGNDHSQREHQSPDDRPAALAAGWRFIDETAFAKGNR